MKKITSFMVSVCLLLLCMSGLSVSADTTYNADKALQYASEHWNDGVGQCAEFVSKCVQAGDVSMDIKTFAGSCFTTVLQNSDAEKYQLSLNEKGQATKADNESILAPGDVVVQYCTTCEKYPHILIFSEFNSDGKACYYAHNGALGNKTFTLSENKALHGKESCNVIAYVAHFPLSTNTEGAQDNNAHGNSNIDNVQKEQKCGDNAYFSVSNGVLTISGNGDMWDFTSGVVFDNTSSIELNQSIHTINVEEGITSLGKMAFVRMSNVKKVSLPSTLKLINAGAFFYVNPEQINYNGSKDDWNNIIDNGKGTTMSLTESFLANITFAKDNISSIGGDSSIEVRDGDLVIAAATISADGNIKSISGSCAYFRPLFTNVTGVTCIRIPENNAVFNYENGMLASVSGDETVAYRKEANVLNAYSNGKTGRFYYIDSKSGNILDYTIEINAKLEPEQKELLVTRLEMDSDNWWATWQYDENNKLISYRDVEMGISYNYSYDTSGKLESFYINNGPLSKKYNYVYPTSLTETAKDEIRVTIDSKFAAFDVQPQLINDRTMVPLRAIFEALGATVDWNDTTQTVIAKKDDIEVIATIGSTRMYVNECAQDMDVAPILIDDRTLVPIRFVAEAFNCDVEWNENTHTVIIESI